jgi:DNA-binding LacI/PurR family transcriptional regulator
LEVTSNAAPEQHSIRRNTSSTATSEDKAYELTTKLLETQKEVTAIFSSNNLMSVGCFEAINDKGLKIPDDISLISFDDFYFFGAGNINISAVLRPTMQMGVEAAMLLVDQIKKKKKARIRCPSGSSSRRISCCAVGEVPTNRLPKP